MPVGVGSRWGQHLTVDCLKQARPWQFSEFKMTLLEPLPTPSADPISVRFRELFWPVTDLALAASASSQRAETEKGSVRRLNTRCSAARSMHKLRHVGCGMRCEPLRDCSGHLRLSRSCTSSAETREKTCLCSVGLDWAKKRKPKDQGDNFIFHPGRYFFLGDPIPPSTSLPVTTW